jgi:flagellar hook-length control protein FliK
MTEGTFLGAVMLPNGRLQASVATSANTDVDASPSAGTGADATKQAPDPGASGVSVAKNLLRLLFAKPSTLLATNSAVPTGDPVAGDGHDSKSTDEASTSSCTSTAVADPSVAAAALLVQAPMQAPITVALKWQEPQAAKTARESPAAPLVTATSGTAGPSAGSPVDMHPAIAAAMTRTQGPTPAMTLTELQGGAAETPRSPRVIPGDGASIDTSGMAAALRAANTTNTPTAAPVEHTVTVPVHDRHWPTAMAAQVLILSGDKVRAATLRLTPEHLGPVEVRIDMQDSSVNVNFTAAHAETRSALEQAMPQLRSVLAGAGLTLGQATVQQQARHASQNPQPVLRGTGSVDDAMDAPVPAWRALGLVDEYA